MPNFNLNDKTLKNMSWFDDYMKSTGSKPSKGSGFLSAIGSMHPLLGVGTNILQNILNRKSIEENNRRQEQMTYESNLQAKQEAEKAYARSRPITQVNEMRLAGMSEQGAINALNGGGSYSPAPINTAQTEASQMDLSGIVNVMQHAADMAEQKRQFDEQMKLEREKMSEQSRQFETSHAETVRVNNATVNKLGLESQLQEVELEISKAVKQGRIDTENAENAQRLVKAVLDKFTGEKMSDIIRGMSDQEIEDLLKLQATMNALNYALEYKLPSQLAKAFNDLKSMVSNLTTQKINLKGIFKRN